MTSRERFLRACACEPLDRPPVWIMRQAGRYLPEYRELKTRHSFLEMVRTPELAAEVTMQPLRRYALDAAIIFSDILVVPEAMGQGYQFRDQGGIGMDFAIGSKADVDRLNVDGAATRLEYVGAALAKVRASLAGERALLGFGGSPWTLASYMVEGGSTEDFARIKSLFHSDRPLFHALLEKLTRVLIEYFHLQIRAGADAIQIFDSWGGVVSGSDYEAASLRWIREIIAALPRDFPVILYAKGTSAQITDQAFSGARVLGLDWTIDLRIARRLVPSNVALQGNLDPVILDTTPEIVRRETVRLLEAMRGSNGHIFNLGHGILPTARLECVESLVETVTNWKN
ncbi:MAG TPA: uroporphyrinogen decarboxylase [Candidatus Didemnitutus sp.]|jgi:uroporphyrinogen decarboxylase